jgi:nitrogen-specific signal transduction histidine kinase
LRALFSKKPAATETVDLNEATREVLKLMFGDLLRNGVDLRLELDHDHPLPVTGDRVQLQQVIMNLVRNASDAMRDVNDRPKHLLVKVEREAGGGARLIMKDAGVGLDPQTAGRLFDAFYTTKSDGMGIGLSVSRSIIESHGGKLWAEANDGPGTTFSFSLPGLAAIETDDRTGEAALPPDARGGHEVMRNSGSRAARSYPWSMTTSRSANRSLTCCRSSASRSRRSHRSKSSSRPVASAKPAV